GRERREVAIRVLLPRRAAFGVGRGPARSTEVLRRMAAEVHPPRREHADVAPGLRMGTGDAALEDMDVEAVIEPGKGGFESDRTGADDGERVASGGRHGARTLEAESSA